MIDLNELIREHRLFDDRYILLRPLTTSGSKSEIWLAIDQQTADSPESGELGEWKDKTGLYVAIKMYRPRHELDLEGEQRFRDEFKAVYECRHANLLQPTGFSVFEGCPYLVLPYCRYGSCEKIIGKPMGIDEIWKFIGEVSAGMERLHTFEPQIVHQDIKPSNILIDNTHSYAITDFGISSKLAGVHGYYADAGEFRAYMAPERFQEEAVPMPKSDIWGFGATLYEILVGKTPFGEDGGKAQVQNHSRMPEMPGVPASIRRLVHACLNPDPQVRPDAHQLVEAARLQQFPIKKRRFPVSIVAAVIVALAAVGIALSRREEPPVIPLSLEESYGIALSLIGSQDRTDFLEGYHMMDSLSNLNYIPAMYQMAYTHGWYNEEESVRRKKMLGIRLEEEDNFPASDIDNQKAITWLQMIMAESDSSYAAINAYAAYRLAGYYRKDRILQRDDKAVVAWMNKARDWALLSGDQDFLDKTEAWLQSIK